MIAKGFFEKEEEALIPVPHGEKSDAVIEPWLMDQWYVDAATLAGPALRAVEQGKTQLCSKICGKIPTLNGLGIFNPGVFLASCGGGTVFLRGMAQREKYLWQ